jgi:predicted transposase/invertase (TIGR01784 family)
MERITRDTLWKGMIQEMFEDFMFFFYPKSAELIDFEAGYDFLDKTLDKLFPESKDVNRQVDKLVKVHLKNGTEQYLLIHIEVQGYNDKAFAERMFRYYYRIYDFLKMPFAAIAIFTDDSPDYHPKSYEIGLEEWETHLHYQYKTYKLYHQNIKLLENEVNIFADLMTVAWYGIRKNKPKTDDELFDLKIQLFRRLISKGHSNLKIKKFVNFISHYVNFSKAEYFEKLDQDIFEITKTREAMGLEEAMLKQVEEYGIGKGIEQGIEQGIEKGVRKTIFQLFKNGFDVLQVSKMLTMDEAIIGNLRAAFEEQQRESEGEGKTDKTHQEKKVIDDEEE